MQQTHLLKRGLDMIYLAACALHDQLPDQERLQSMELEHIYPLACLHSIQSVVYMAIEKSVEAYGNDVVDAELLVRWRRSYGNELKKLLSFEVERERLTTFLEQQGAWYSCLKGIVLQDYYPRLGMRQMSDNDILIDPSFAPRVNKFLKDAGYQVKAYGVSNHDVYAKGNIYFELHRGLVSDSSRHITAAEYYRCLDDRLHAVGQSCERRLTPEDFYVYFMSHAQKHFSGNGYGVRFFIDTYVYTSATEATLDASYVARELDVLSLTDFERQMRSLAHKLFSTPGSQPVLDEQEQEVLLYCLSSGTFGTCRTYVSNSLHRMSSTEHISLRVRLKHLWRRVFPPYKYYKTCCPKLARWLLPIPVLWGMRLIRGLSRPRRVLKELHYIRKTK